MTCMRHCSLKRFLWILFLFIMEAVDLVLDWDFYTEIETELKTAILVFAIVGTITFVLGLFSLYYDATKDNEHLTFCTIVSVISTWIEDVPQIIFAVIFAVSSSEVISNVQYVKAGYAIFEASVHIMLSLWQVCCRGEEYAKKPKYLRRFIIVEACGGGVILVCSIFLIVELIKDTYH